MVLLNGSPELQFICDRDGRCYRLQRSVDGSRWYFQVFDGETLVGEAKCVLESAQRMALGDIAIANEVIPTPVNRLLRSLRQLPGLAPMPVNYRGRGLGTALLLHLIAHSRQSGAQELCGEVFQQDVENSPGLLGWYQRMGFQCYDPEKTSEADVIARICLDLGCYLKQDVPNPPNPLN